MKKTRTNNKKSVISKKIIADNDKETLIKEVRTPGSWVITQECSMQTHATIGSDEKLINMFHSDNCKCIHPFKEKGHYYYDGENTIHFKSKKALSFSRIAISLFFISVVFLIFKYIEFLYHAR